MFLRFIILIYFYFIKNKTSIKVEKYYEFEPPPPTNIAFKNLIQLQPIHGSHLYKRIIYLNFSLT